ncbi:MAG TPA: DEAD/DEAH box helicase [Candidatus Krumholzibacteria bacterium]
MKGKWHLTAEPHVMVRAKRIFPRVSQHLDRLEITDTTEVCRDIEWLLQRFPLAMTRRTRERLVQGARDHRAHGERVHQILVAETSTREFPLALPLRDYQKVAAELAYQTKGLLLADDMGVGKTASAIGLLSLPGGTPALVATPAGIIPWQWEKEINRFAPGLKTHVVKKSTPYEIGGLRRTSTGLESSYPDVVISTYYRLRGWRDHLAGKFRTVVGDEIQKLINPQSEISRAFDHIAEGATYRLGLSGTPINNLGAEMYPVMEHLAPGRLGERHEFLREWCGAEDNRGRASLRDPAAFGTYLRTEGLMLRRTRKDVGRELPGLTKVFHQVEWDDAKLRDIERPAAELARIILSSEAVEREVRRDAAREFSMILRQATGIAKAVAVADFVKLAVENGERVLLFGWHRSVYDLWEERLKDYAPAWFTGSESESAKRRSHERFLDGGTSVLIMSLRAGAGIDGLQKVCRTIVFGELDWSPAVHEQDVTRIFRDGQEHPVFAYYVLCDAGSDPVIADILGVKRAQLEGIRDPSGAFLENLDIGGDHVKRLAAAYLRKVAA